MQKKSLEIERILLLLKSPGDKWHLLGYRKDKQAQTHIYEEETHSRREWCP